MPTITIIETGLVPAPLRGLHGSYPQMFARALGAASDDLTFETIVAADACYPEAGSLQAILITGSPAGVYEDLPWIAPLAAFVLRVHAAGVPMVGICFGHQLIAQALGGVVRKSDRGWGAGRHLYRVTAGNGVIDRDEVALACSHQDQVVVPPKGAAIVLSSEFTPYAGLFYEGGTILSLQPHPEFTADFARDLCRYRAAQTLGFAGSAVEASLALPLDSASVNRALGSFLTVRPDAGLPIGVADRGPEQGKATCLG